MSIKCPSNLWQMGLLCQVGPKNAVYRVYEAQCKLMAVLHIKGLSLSLPRPQPYTTYITKEILIRGNKQDPSHL